MVVAGRKKMSWRWGPLAAIEREGGGGPVVIHCMGSFCGKENVSGARGIGGLDWAVGLAGWAGLFLLFFLFRNLFLFLIDFLF